MKKFQIHIRGRWPVLMDLTSQLIKYQHSLGQMLLKRNVIRLLQWQSSDLIENAELKEAAGVSGRKYREFICGEEALKISPTEPYCLRRPIRRGHFNVSPYYPAQQVLEDLHALWEWILTEKLHIPLSRRNMYSALLVVPETFDNREIKELLSIVLGDLQFNVAVVHQEALATVFGNGLSTACVVNIGAQATSVICVEDGVTLPTTEITLSFGGEDISRCMLWTQRHHQTWPPIRTDAVAKPIDLLMLNRLKESYCQIKESEIDAVAVVHSYEDGMPAVAHKIRLTALNVAPMGLFYPKLLVPEVYPPPPRTWYHDYEDMLEDTSNLEYPRRPDGSDLYPGFNGGLPMWETYPIVTNKPKKLENIGLAEAITKSILSTGRIDLQRKLFCSIQLGGGVSLTNGLVAAVEDRVLHAIPPNEAIDTVEVLPSRHDPAYVSWKGGVLLGILDFTHEAWIHRLDWVSGGLYVGSKRKYRESYYIQAQPMCYMNS
ncbi:actin-related protein 9 isoform X5 [Beta vulgaris subsp. vulgaris]|uniref:actin-related protein 9 isoform X5 n=1 Tax=Beta vulgaris subsp. vulgaris TaxID=3555 RepID=UPI002036D79B|nr:actin-related protein 9 isoform X5 [Beta vulgaris subsp. vulgaris]XP_048497058.1 actin-related protein 9 isoform X5 [Beta vulgaris subsp. vulgaris]